MSRNVSISKKKWFFYWGIFWCDPQYIRIDSNNPISAIFCCLGSIALLKWWNIAFFVLYPNIKISSILAALSSFFSPFFIILFNQSTHNLCLLSSIFDHSLVFISTMEFCSLLVDSLFFRVCFGNIVAQALITNDEMR